METRPRNNSIDDLMEQGKPSFKPSTFVWMSVEEAELSRFETKLDEHWQKYIDESDLVIP